VSRYDLFRRRIAPIAFLVAIALIARDSCDKEQRTHTAVELDFGDARPRVRAVDVEVFTGVNGVTGSAGVSAEPIARFHRNALSDTGIGPCRFDLASPDPDGELHIDVDLGAEHRTMVRRFRAVEGSTLHVPLADDLRPR
jgi:hypothetical protein